MKQRVVAAVAVVACVFALAGCSPGGGWSSGDAGQGAAKSIEAAEPADDAVAIEQIDWTVQEEVIDGDRCVSFGYVNNSDYSVVSVMIEFAQRDDVIDEQRSVFDEMYAEDSPYVPPVEASELYIAAENQHYVEPGGEAESWRCDLSYSLTPPTMEQYELMEPDVAHIRYIGADGNIYSEYYDFTNDTYRLDEDDTEEVITFDTWPTNELAQLMPQMEAAAITIENNTDESFRVLAYGITEEDFASYVDQCKKTGFNIVDDENSIHYVLRDADGYVVDITYYALYDYYYAEITSPEA